MGSGAPHLVEGADPLVDTHVPAADLDLVLDLSDLRHSVIKIPEFMGKLCRLGWSGGKKRVE